MSINRKIEFMFNNIPNRFNLSLNYLLSQKDNLNLVIKNECNTHMDMSIFVDNIILYDINNDIIINTVQDLVENKTKKCKIIIKPISY